MKVWTRQLLYIARDSVSGVIVGMQEARPDGYREPQEEALRKPRKRRKDATINVVEKL